MASIPLKLKDWQRKIIESRPGPEFRPAGSASLEQVFALYQNNRNGSRRRALVLSFPLLAKLMGRGRFEALCQAYIDEQPYHSGSLNYYGRGLEKYLSSEFLDQPDLGLFQLLAKFEWCLQELLLKPANIIVTMAQLQAMTEAQQQSFQLCFMPNYVALRSYWSLDALWLWHQQNLGSIQTLAAKNEAAGYNVAWLVQAELTDGGLPNSQMSDGVPSHNAMPTGVHIAVHYLNGLESELFEQLQKKTMFTLPDLWRLCETLKLDFPTTLQKLMKRQWLTCISAPGGANTLIETGYDR